MTELSFLIDLLMNHKLQKATKDLIAERIREVEAYYVSEVRIPASAKLDTNLLNQAPSTIALMARHTEAPINVAQTPAAAAALASRRQAISEAMSGKIPKGQEKPRKW